MHHAPASRLSCVVCGRESRRHEGWFLVVENPWLDRIKILAWHPAVARLARLQSVCGKEHLKTLLTHWLTHANLQFLAAGASHWRFADDPIKSACDSVSVSGGKLVGELAVHRESLSRVWTGSPEALECILTALIGGMENEVLAQQVSLPDATADIQEYALH